LGLHFRENHYRIFAKIYCENIRKWRKYLRKTVGFSLGLLQKGKARKYVQAKSNAHAAFSRK
jgi:hypothetical protein